MKNELLKTGIWAGAALVLVIAAVSVEPDVRRSQIFSDQGELLFPNLRDPNEAKSIEVIDYNEAEATARPLKAELRKGKWVLSSHYDYPAEAKDRIARTAAGLVDLKKDVVVSDRFEDHGKYGVIDPIDAKVTSLTGRGKRVTLKDQAGAVIADLVLGEVDKKRAGYRFIRVPGQKRVYEAKTDADPSARFEDWVEGNLLRLSPGQIQRILILNYSLGEQEGRAPTMQRAVLTPAGREWKQEGGTPIPQARIQSMITALCSLRPTGVRPKPPSLADQLRGEQGLEMTLDAVMSLRQRGFLITPEGRLLASEGELVVDLGDKKNINLRFGDVASSTGESKPEVKGPQENRYVFISAGDPALRSKFADWYYILTGSDIERLHPLRAAASAKTK